MFGFKTDGRVKFSGIAPLAAAVGLFYVNDIVFVLTETTGQWLVLDYGFRLAALGLVFSSSELRAHLRDFRRLRIPVFGFVLLVSALTFCTFIFFRGLQYKIDAAFGDWRLFSFPRIESPALFVLDVTLGLALVALSEEIVFRAAFLGAARSRNWPGPMILLVSSLAFALAHWSLGVGSIAAAFLTGILFMAATMRTGSVLPAMAAHYIVIAFIFGMRAPQYESFASFAGR